MTAGGGRWLCGLCWLRGLARLMIVWLSLEKASASSIMRCINHRTSPVVEVAAGPVVDDSVAPLVPVVAEVAESDEPAVVVSLAARRNQISHFPIEYPR